MILSSVSFSLLLTPSTVFFSYILQLYHLFGTFLYFVSVEITTLLMHCSPDLGKHLYGQLIWTLYQVNYLSPFP